jgi:hypothetical protein
MHYPHDPGLNDPTDFLNNSTKLQNRTPPAHSRLRKRFAHAQIFGVYEFTCSFCRAETGNALPTAARRPSTIRASTFFLQHLNRYVL